MKHCFALVGMDTDAGKTVVTAGLARAIHKLGKRAAVLKPVQTGCRQDLSGRLEAPDVAVVKEACPEALCEALVMLRNACSPHLAARLEEQCLTVADLAGSIRGWIAQRSSGVVLLECAGGLMVPLNDQETQRDLLRCLGIPVLLVIPNRLGAINHALLTVEVLRADGCAIAGIILNHPGGSSRSALENACDPSAVLERRIQEDNRVFLTERTGLPCLAEVPFVEELSSPLPETRAKGWDEVAAALQKAVHSLVNGQEREKREEDEATTAKARIRYDREHIWHPYTSALHPLPVREAVETAGSRIVLRDGRRLIDGMASWWCAVHGYNHPVLQRALITQARSMPHVMFGGLTHAPAVDLVRKLLGMAPEGLEHVFFADSGSVAVEVAMKMAVQYQQAMGSPGKNVFLTVGGGYHGDTLGAMSVCDPKNGMHSLFTGFLPRQLFASRPACRFDRPYDDASVRDFERTLIQNADRVAAVILEPVLQGAGGMWMYHPEYVRRVRELCDHYGCLLIHDEIATGFGRTGKLFACQWADVVPDIMCVGKALTGGVMSLAATLATKRVAEGVSAEGGVLMHGPTFMGNPLACAVASASLDLLEEGAWKGQVDMIESTLREELAPCRAMEGVADVRILGAVGVVEMTRTVCVEKAQEYFVRHGVWIRPFGRLLYIMPPYVTPRHEVRKLAGTLRGVVRESAWE